MYFSEIRSDLISLRSCNIQTYEFAIDIKNTLVIEIGSKLRFCCLYDDIWVTITIYIADKYIIYCVSDQ